MQFGFLLYQPTTAASSTRVIQENVQKMSVNTSLVKAVNMPMVRYHVTL